MEEDPEEADCPRVRDLEPWVSTWGPRWQRKMWILVGGKANTGKTTVLAQLAHELARNNENIGVIYFTLDDDQEIIINRMVTLECLYDNIDPFDAAFTMTNVADIRRIQSAQPGLYNVIAPVREEAYATIRNLIAEDRLIIKDSTLGNSVEFAKAVVRDYRQRHPQRDLIIMIDNFHNLTIDGKVMGQNKEAFVNAMSKAVKVDLAMKQNATVIASGEYSKLDAFQLPSNRSFADTRALELDPKLLTHLYCDMAESQSAGQSDRCKFYYEWGSIKYPIIKMYAGKNKLSSFKGELHWVLFPDLGKYKFMTREELEVAQRRMQAQEVEIDGRFSFTHDDLQ
jgi:KaiC/GvpD/RAD55 family RecA-like ATPase